MVHIFHLLESISFGLSIHKFISQGTSVGWMRRSDFLIFFSISGDYLLGRYMWGITYYKFPKICILSNILFVSNPNNLKKTNFTFFPASEEVSVALFVTFATLVKIAHARGVAPLEGTTTYFPIHSYLALECTGQQLCQQCSHVLSRNQVDKAFLSVVEMLFL